VDALTRRAERALLGAMVADPRLARVLRVAPEEFGDARHGDWYRSILAAGQRGRPVLEGWREAILAADPSLDPADLDGLVADCPYPSHGPAYEIMVVQAWSRRFLQEAARRLGEGARQDGRDAGPALVADIRAGVGAATAADHVARVATTMRDHTDGVSPRLPHGTSPEQGGASTERARREELVLAGLLGQAPRRAAEILRIVTAAAFSDPYRREVFQIAAVMHQRGRAVDELTLDWELAMHGVPVAAGPGRRAGDTYGKCLACIEVPGYTAPVDAAREVQALHEKACRPRVVRGGLPWTPGPQRAHGDDAAVAQRGRPRLRLIARPPEGDGPARGPEQR
jgi:hypothetical protein